ncbi:MAG: DUF3842 family protein [Clostridiales bacterium]|nr:DUF3842 family protein [Clostridiales bacterium]MBQ3107781.1 DUF3842 family protein [Bacillota bacterium]
MKETMILIIDGQGGRIGAQLVAQLKQQAPGAVITAVGTNSMATSAMLKAGADQAATGENAVLTCCRRAHVIAGPLGIAVADSFLGEVTPAMAVAVGQSEADKVFIPANRCGNMVAGIGKQPLGDLIDDAVRLILQSLA